MRTFFSVVGSLWFILAALGLGWTVFVRSTGFGNGVATNDILYIAILVRSLAEMVAGLGICWLAERA